MLCYNTTYVVQCEKGVKVDLIKDYMTVPNLRHALNDLARRTFCIDFEDWVSDGWFEGDYIPYSFLGGEKQYFPELSHA